MQWHIEDAGMNISVLMKCGCVAQGVCSGKGGVKFDPPIPSCIVHDCIEVAQEQPDLIGRVARCRYFGRGGFRQYGPIHGGGKCSRVECECLVPSNYALPFFTYGGDKSASDSFFCGCRE